MMGVGREDGNWGTADTFPSPNLNSQRNVSLVPAKYETSDHKLGRGERERNKWLAMIATASASAFRTFNAVALV